MKRKLRQRLLQWITVLFCLASRPALSSEADEAAGPICQVKPAGSVEKKVPLEVYRTALGAHYLYKDMSEGMVLVTTSSGGTCLGQIYGGSPRKVCMPYHCVRRHRKTLSVRISPFVYFTEPPKPPDEEGWVLASYEGYRPDSGSAHYFTAATLLLNKEKDLACARLPAGGWLDALKSLTLTASTTFDYQTVFLAKLHQRIQWEKVGNGVRVHITWLLDGEFAFRKSRREDGQEGYFVSGHPGTSGGAILNSAHEVVGMFRSIVQGKTELLMIFATSAKDISEFLRTAFREQPPRSQQPR